MKKGNMLLATVLLITVATSILLMTWFVGKTKEAIFEPKYDCVASLEILHQKGPVDVSTFEKNTKNCAPQDLMITVDPTSRQAYFEMANVMKECWNLYGQGKKRFLGSGNFCTICATIEFEKKDAKITDFATFLDTHRVATTTRTYTEYLKPRNKDIITPYKKTLPKQTPDVIDTKQIQEVVFYYRGFRNAEFTDVYGGMVFMLPGTQEALKELDCTWV